MSTTQLDSADSAAASKLAHAFWSLCHHDLPTARSALDDWVEHLALYFPEVFQDMTSVSYRNSKLFASLDTYVIALGELERLARDR